MDVTDYFIREEADSDSTDYGTTTETIYGIALTDSEDGYVTVCTSPEECSEEATAYQELRDSGTATEEELAAALSALLAAASSESIDNEPDFDDETEEGTSDEFNEGIEDGSVEEEEEDGPEMSDYDSDEEDDEEDALTVGEGE